MLLFILLTHYVLTSNFHFNTSHVTVYLATISFFPLRLGTFQYISCYCLSILERYVTLSLKDFNTSHVTVYHILQCLYEVFLQISIHLMLLFIVFWQYHLTTSSAFQYISCYCLSWSWVIWWKEKIISIHLMLLFIITINAERFQFCNFNTSHVTVYQMRIWTRSDRTGISIHLMLLFIRISHVALATVCYFNTSHVTVYHRAVLDILCAIKFQYISCYCLSNELTPFYIFLRI